MSTFAAVILGSIFYAMCYTGVALALVSVGNLIWSHIKGTWKPGPAIGAWRGEEGKRKRDADILRAVGGHDIP